MQPDRSSLFESLKAYLNNSRRLQPVIGLESITECVTAGAMNRVPLYFCNVCVCRCSKSDIRNHIFGSHHRFNYIKAWHPQLLISWQEDNDLSAMAWPLMELAKMVEEKEGPGEAQLIEVREALYQKMATLSETDAVTLIMVLRGGLTEVVSCADTTAASTQSQRIVLQKQERGNDVKCAQDDTPSLETSGESSENASFLDDYTGAKPLIGLLYVVEYRSEYGSSSCFLCHCCRVRANKKDITDHITSPRHLINYIMETCPEQVEGVSAESDALQALARKVGKSDCRGGLKVVNVPESLSRLLTANSYHCCLKILRGEWTHTDVPEKKDTLEGPGVTETSGRFTPQRNTAKLSKRKKKMKSRTDPVFNVSLPLSGGALLLERTSFAVDATSVSSGSPSADLDPVHSPEYGSFTESDDDGTSSCEPSRFQHGEGEDVGGDYSQYVHVTETTDHEGHQGRSYSNLTVTLETPSETSYTECQYEYDPETPDDGPTPAVSCYPGRSHWEGGKEYWCTSNFNGRTGANAPGVEQYADTSSAVVQHYDQQQLGYQHMAGCAASLPAGVPYGPPDWLYEPVPHSNASRTHTQTQHGGDVPETSGQLHQTGTLQTHQELYSHWA